MLIQMSRVIMLNKWHVTLFVAVNFNFTITDVTNFFCDWVIFCWDLFFFNPYVKNGPKYFFIETWQYIHQSKALVEFRRFQLLLKSFRVFLVEKYSKNSEKIWIFSNLLQNRQKVKIVKRWKSWKAKIIKKSKSWKGKIMKSSNREKLKKSWKR